MASSSTRNSAAQPCTSPIANTVSPPRANGAGFQSEISTGSATAASMPPMLALSGAALHCRQRPALELLLDGAIEVEAQGRRIAARDPEMGGQRVMAVIDALDADVGDPQHPLVALGQLLQ